MLFPPPTTHAHTVVLLSLSSYEVLCEAVDSLVAISGHMSQVMGVPLKEFSSTKSAEPEQVDSVPSSPGEGQLDHIGDVLLLNVHGS